jgi:fatty acid desaturase
LRRAGFLSAQHFCKKRQSLEKGEHIMEPFFSFMASMAGRVTRIIAGLALVLIGFLVLGGFWGWILAIVGLVPLLAGLFDRCVFAPLFGLPFVGPRLRQALEDKGK